MTSNFRFIETNIDVTSILKQVLDNPQDWSAAGTWDGIAGDLNPDGFLPLKLAKLEFDGQDIKNSELSVPSPLYLSLIHI